MANCNQCGKDVGCGCNLVGGVCVGCYSKAQAEGQSLAPQRKRERYVAPPREPAPLTTFETIFKQKGLSKEEKIKRINDILENARKSILT
jgi:hypothetical protein